MHPRRHEHCLHQADNTYSLNNGSHALTNTASHWVQHLHLTTVQLRPCAVGVIICIYREHIPQAIRVNVVELFIVSVTNHFMYFVVQTVSFVVVCFSCSQLHTVARKCRLATGGLCSVESTWRVDACRWPWLNLTYMSVWFERVHIFINHESKHFECKRVSSCQISPC